MTTLDQSRLNYMPGHTEAGRLMNEFLRQASVNRLGTVTVGPYYAYPVQDENGKAAYHVHKDGARTDICFYNAPEPVINHLAMRMVPIEMIVRDWDATSDESTSGNFDFFAPAAE